MEEKDVAMVAWTLNMQEYARMWTFHNLVVAQNEGGGTYLD